jgi:hypothetical protein
MNSTSCGSYTITLSKRQEVWWLKSWTNPKLDGLTWTSTWIIIYLWFHQIWSYHTYRVNIPRLRIFCAKCIWLMHCVYSRVSPLKLPNGFQWNFVWLPAWHNIYITHRSNWTCQFFQFPLLLPLIEWITNKRQWSQTMCKYDHWKAPRIGPSECSCFNTTP